MKPIFKSIGFLFLMGSMLFCSSSVIAGASEGLLIWYRTLVPALFPFMILSNIMIRTDSLRPFLQIIHPVFHFLFKTSLYGSYCILCGFLFGYPMGAKAVYDLFTAGKLSEKEAKHLIGFVNNPSPTFLVVYVCGRNFPGESSTLFFLFCIYGVSVLTGILSSLPFRFEKKRIRYRNDAEHADIQNKTSTIPLSTELIDVCMFDGIRQITKLGVYLMFFSIVIQLCSLFPCMKTTTGSLFLCTLELTTGIQIMKTSGLPYAFQYSFSMFLCCFGGICTLFQTKAVCPVSREIYRRYLITKLLSAAAAFSISLFLCQLGFL